MPFNVAPVESADQQPTEVRLYVSANLGGKWDMSQRVPPETRSFTFRAPGDGEYWFLIRTVDRLGRVIPDVGGRPDMRVIVDTIPPRLELTATRCEAGEIKANWLAVDPLLNADSLKIEYQTTSGAWRPVGVDRPRSGGDRTTSKGTLTWWPTDAPATPVQVRAEISDRAGNIATMQVALRRLMTRYRDRLLTAASYWDLSRSSKGRPRFRYSLETLTTKLRFDSMSSFSDARSPRFTPSARAISSSFVRRGYSRISEKYRDRTELRSLTEVSI
jgi:hypothetical protein